MLEALCKESADLIREYLSSFLEALTVHEAVSGEVLDFSDCALVNCVYVGAFIQHGNDLYRAVDRIEGILGLTSHVYPISGQNRYLVSIRRDGTVLASEVETDSCPLRELSDLFALAARMTDVELASLGHLPPDLRGAYLTSLSDFPEPGSLCRRSISQADVIVLCPGTLSTSLLPTYLARGLGSLVRSNTKAVKVLVTNISRTGGGDVECARDILVATVQALRRSDDYPGNTKDYVNAVIVNKLSASEDPTDHVTHSPRDIDEDGITVAWHEYEDVKSHGIHDGSRVAHTVLELFKRARCL